MKLVSEMDFLTEDELLEVQFETKMQVCEAVIETLTDYDKEILELYIECGSLRGVARRTLIPKSSVHETIMRIRGMIKERLCA